VIERGCVWLVLERTSNEGVSLGQEAYGHGKGEGAKAGNQRRRKVHLQADNWRRLRTVHDNTMEYATN
jgi:hypothetical protein